MIAGTRAQVPVKTAFGSQAWMLSQGHRYVTTTRVTHAALLPRGVYICRFASVLKIQIAFESLPIGRSAIGAPTLLVQISRRAPAVTRPCDFTPDRRQPCLLLSTYRCKYPVNFPLITLFFQAIVRPTNFQSRGNRLARSSGYDR